MHFVANPLTGETNVKEFMLREIVLAATQAAKSAGEGYNAAISVIKN